MFFRHLRNCGVKRKIRGGSNALPPFNPQAVWDAGVEEMNEAMHQVGNNERSRLLATLLMRFQQFLPSHDAMIALNGVAKLMHDTDTTNGTVIIIRKDGSTRL